MTAIADKIRVLFGTEEAMGLDNMAEYVGEANSEVDNQVELLAQAIAALEGKTSGGSSDESNGIKSLVYPYEITIIGDIEALRIIASVLSAVCLMTVCVPQPMILVLL